MKQEKIIISLAIIIVLLLLFILFDNDTIVTERIIEKAPEVILINNTHIETIIEKEVIAEPDIVCRMPRCYLGHGDLNSSVVGSVVWCSDDLNRFRYCNGTIRMDRIY